jgi:hypothetical protein
VDHDGRRGVGRQRVLDGGGGGRRTRADGEGEQAGRRDAAAGDVASGAAS